MIRTLLCCLNYISTLVCHRFFNVVSLKIEVFMHLYSKVETSAGSFWVGCSQAGITMIALAKGSSGAFEAAYNKRFGIRPQPGKISARYSRALKNAAAGRKWDPAPIDLTSLSEFQQKVLTILRCVPSGEVRTYKELAALAGRPKAVRAVGNTMARNPVPILIPCHRVVPSTGGIGNYGLGVALKRALLLREGVRVEEL
jgi:O-6-methylguanine DNA methyltransferase